MSKNSYILMVFEGQRTEPQILENIKKYFFKKSDKTIIKAVYGTVIYKLYQEFFPKGIFDEDLELFPLLKEMANSDELKDIKRNQVSQIYFFFDYDGHASNADDEKLHKMLELFNNETENGKLYVSYPMVEAIKHLKEGIDFKDTIEASTENYKQIVNKNCDEDLINLNWLKEKHWLKIIQEHSKKANFIVNDAFSFPTEIIEQLYIFHNQKQKFIEPHNKVAVLASFPLFLFDYYGVEKFKKVECLESVTKKE